MPTVEIQRSNSRLPTTFGIRDAGRVEADRGAGQALQEIGEQLSLAADSSYVANTSVQVSATMEEVKSARQREFFDNPTGYAKAVAEDFQNIRQDALRGATSLRARTSMEGQLASFEKSNALAAGMWEKQASIESFLDTHEESMNLLSNMVASNPSSYAGALDQMKGLQEAGKMYLDPSQFGNLSSKDEKQLMESLFIGTLGTNPAGANSLLESPEFRRKFDAKEIEGLQRVIERKVKKEVRASTTSQTIRGASTFIKAAQGSISLSEIDNDPDLSEEDRALAKGVLYGDRESLIALGKKLPKGGDSYENHEALKSGIEKVKITFNNSDKTDKDFVDAMAEINSIKNQAAILRSAPGKRKGTSQITQKAYDDVLKNVSSSLSVLAEKGDFGSPIFNQTGYDAVYKRIGKLVGTGDTEAPLRAELLGYAGKIAEDEGIPLHDMSTVAITDTSVNKIMKGLEAVRRETLGVPSDVPPVGSVIVGGKKEKLGSITGQSGSASRGIKAAPTIRIKSIREIE